MYLNANAWLRRASSRDACLCRLDRVAKMIPPKEAAVGGREHDPCHATVEFDPIQSGPMRCYEYKRVCTWQLMLVHGMYEYYALHCAVDVSS